MTYGPYSPVRQSGNLFFVSGQVGVDPKTGRSAKSVKAQTTQALENLKSQLATCDMGLEHVVKTTVFLTDMSHFDTVNDVYKGFFRSPFPARSCIAVKELPRVGTNSLLVEIEAVAIKE
jgi:2-iminobutanoate/2-iminopropanoate deaminase